MTSKAERRSKKHLTRNRKETRKMLRRIGALEYLRQVISGTREVPLTKRIRERYGDCNLTTLKQHWISEADAK
jgi:hypothetical protein